MAERTWIGNEEVLVIDNPEKQDGNWTYCDGEWVYCHCCKEEVK